MFPLLPRLSVLSLLFVLNLAGIVGAAPEVLLAPAQSDVELHSEAMPVLSDCRVGQALSRHYNLGLGGAEAWQQVTSVRLQGKLITAEGEFELTGYHKKPNLLKIILASAERETVYSFDGESGWMQQIRPLGAPQGLPAGMAAHFVQHAAFGGHLLYPYSERKLIQYLDTLPVESKLCDQVRVTLGSDYQLDYFIDIATHQEVKRRSLDLHTGHQLSMIFCSDSREAEQAYSRKISLLENEAWWGTVELEVIQINPGIMSWMFTRPPSSASADPDNRHRF